MVMYLASYLKSQNAKTSGNLENVNKESGLVYQIFEDKKAVYVDFFDIYL
jgi:hypothetical protein